MRVAWRAAMNGVALLAAVFGRTTPENRTAYEEALRIARARAAARAEIDVFLAVVEVSSFVPAKCAALVRAWGALASMEALVCRDAIAVTAPRVPRALADLPHDFVESVLACAQTEAWVDVAAPSERELDGQRRLLLRAFADLDRRVPRGPVAARLPWRLVGRVCIALLVLVVAAASVAFALNRPRWRVWYYANESLSGQPALATRAHEADNYWGRGGPGVALPTDHFSARFETCLVTAQPLSILFTVGSDDGSRLFVDDNEVIDAWSSQPYTEHGKSVPLEAGPHTLRLEYFEREGHARLTFSGLVEGSRADVSAMLHLPRDIGPLKDACRAASR